MEAQVNFAYGGIFGRPAGVGRVFFVDGINGNNNNKGDDPNAPLATITYALTQCVDARGDYIFVMSSPTEPAYPVLIALDSVHIIGLGVHGCAPSVMIDGGGATCFQLTTDGDRVEIAGIGFASDTEDGILGMDAYGCWIHHCTFGGSYCFSVGALRTGIVCTQPASWLIEECFFGSGDPTWGSLQGYGIDGAGLVNTIIRNCYFMNCALGAIRSSGGNMELGWIINNKFYHGIAQTPPLGWAINLVGVGANYGGMIDGNHATECGDSTVTNNPYRDLSTGFLNTSRGWGLNYVNDVPTDPAVA